MRQHLKVKPKGGKNDYFKSRYWIAFQSKHSQGDRVAQVINSVDDGPYAVRRKLEWTVLGLLGVEWKQRTEKKSLQVESQ